MKIENLLIGKSWKITLAMAVSQGALCALACLGILPYYLHALIGGGLMASVMVITTDYGEMRHIARVRLFEHYNRRWHMMAPSERLYYLPRLNHIRDQIAEYEDNRIEKGLIDKKYL